jgi:hypothetical protein
MGKDVSLKSKPRQKPIKWHMLSLEIYYLPKLINPENPNGHAITWKSLQAMLVQQSQVNKGK